MISAEIFLLMIECNYLNMNFIGIMCKLLVCTVTSNDVYVL